MVSGTHMLYKRAVSFPKATSPGTRDEQPKNNILERALPIHPSCEQLSHLLALRY